MGDDKLCRAGQELRRNVRAVHEQHSQLFRAQAQFSSSGNAKASRRWGGGLAAAAAGIDELVQRDGSP